MNNCGEEKMKVAEGALEGKIRGEIRYRAPMAEYTSFRVGGPADCLAFPADREDLRILLQWCRQETISYIILGKGTNLLVRDGGIRGLAINLSRGFNQVVLAGQNPEGTVVLAEAGESLAKFVEFSWKHNLVGMEFAAGIPGSIGGAIFMNAGAFRREMKDVLVSILMMDAFGDQKEKKIEEMKFSYRSIGVEEGEVILGGMFFLKSGGGEKSRAQIEEIMGARLAKQPYDLPSAGSVFKNPPRAAAGRLIEEVGLKGFRIGDAQISPKHANFIVNLGKASARDILELVEIVREKVYREKKVLLEMEIQVAGQN
jgi:UDP-N-acetylmuramate dehydrogenase